MAINPNRVRGVIQYGTKREPDINPQGASANMLYYGGANPYVRQEAIEGRYLPALPTGSVLIPPAQLERERSDEKRVLAAARNYYTQSVADLPSPNYWGEFRNFALVGRGLSRAEAEAQEAQRTSGKRYKSG